MAKLFGGRKSLAYHLTQPVVVLLAKTHITPNTITWFGFLLAIGATVLIIIGHPFAAGFVVLIAGFFDILDGALARLTKKVTTFGSILDSTLDRLSEGALLLGLLVLFANQGNTTGIILVGVVLIASMLVSYIRAKAESMNIECLVGIFTRPERVIVLALGLLINQLEIMLGIIAGFSLLTVCQRLIHVWRQTKKRKVED